MSRLRFAVLAFASTALVLVGLAGYLVATFDPDDYRARIAALVKDRTQRTLTIEGRTALSFWPDIAVDFGPATLSERDGDDVFARVERARLRLSLRPLLSGKWVASEISIRGGFVHVVRFADGRLNLSDLLSHERDAPDVDIGRIALTDCAVRYSDVSAGTQWTLSDVALTTGRIAEGVASPVKLAFAAADMQNVPALSSRLEATLTPYFVSRRYALERTRIEVNGMVGAVSDLFAAASGDVLFDASSMTATVREPRIRLSRGKPKETVTADVGGSDLVVTRQRAFAQTVKAQIRAFGAAGAANASISAKALEHTGEVVQADASRIELDVERGEGRVQADGHATLALSLKTRTLRFEAIEADLTAAAPFAFPGRILGRVSGQGTLDLSHERLAVQLAGKLDRSAIRAVLSSTGFAKPVYAFTLDVDALDLDRYNVAGARARKAPAVPDVAALAELPASGTLRIGTLTAGGARATDVTLTLKP